jgi:hemerythrin-like metal-binding protein
MGSDWMEELVLGHEELDRQHREMFELLAIAAGAAKAAGAELEGAVARLADAIVEHIAAEEAVMEETLFPERARHKSAHDLFLADFHQLRDELREKGPTGLVAQGLEVRIPEWLRFHIRVNDALLREHLARKRPQPGDARQRKTASRLS